MFALPEGPKQWQRRELATQLRKQGLSYREIAERIGVSKGTLSLWCRDIELSSEQLARLAANGQAAGARRGATKRATHERRHEAIRRDARVEAARLRDDPLWIAGTVAYWAEGSKAHDRLRFTNSDPGMVRLFQRWATRHLGVESFAIHLNLHTGQDELAAKHEWAQTTGIPVAEFGRTVLKTEGTGHRKRVLYHGTATLSGRRSLDALVRALAWIDVLRTEQRTDMR